MAPPVTSAPSRKEETRERILRTAARALRSRGYQGVGVAEVMQEAGLTHGGFYAHFASKDALLAEATDRAGADGLERLARAARKSEAPDAPEAAVLALIDAYLSEQHQLEAGLGCPMAALGSELPRQSEAVRRAATHRLEDMVGLIERQMPGWGQPGNHERAMAILSCLVGSLVLARAVDKPTLADGLRASARGFLAEALASAPKPAPKPAPRRRAR